MIRPTRQEFLLDQAEFARILRLGLGRAVLHLDDNDATPYRDTLLHACLNLSQITYDPQIESSRGRYLMELIQRSGDEAFFRRQILDALVSSQDTYDLNQLFELTGILAARGDAEARQAMYDRFGALTTDDDIHFYTDKLLDADGEAAFRFLLDRYGAISKAEPDYWFDDGLLIEARERLGEDIVQRIVAEATVSSSDVRAYIDAAREYRERIQRGSPADDRFLSMTYAELLDAMSSPSQRKPRGQGFFFFRWGTRASDDDITRVANDVLKCDAKDPHLLWRLQIFSSARFHSLPIG